MTIIAAVLWHSVVGCCAHGSSLIATNDVAEQALDAVAGHSSQPQTQGVRHVCKSHACKNQAGKVNATSDHRGDRSQANSTAILDDSHSSSETPCHCPSHCEAAACVFAATKSACDWQAVIDLLMGPAQPIVLEHLAIQIYPACRFRAENNSLPDGFGQLRRHLSLGVLVI